jgi:hypothetical protein
MTRLKYHFSYHVIPNFVLSNYPGNPTSETSDSVYTDSEVSRLRSPETRTPKFQTSDPATFRHPRRHRHNRRRHRHRHTRLNGNRRRHHENRRRSS